MLKKKCSQESPKVGHWQKWVLLFNVGVFFEAFTIFTVPPKSPWLNYLKACQRFNQVDILLQRKGQTTIPFSYGTKWYCWWKKILHQLRLVVCRTIHRVSKTSQVVVWDFWTIDSTRTLVPFFWWGKSTQGCHLCSIMLVQMPQSNSPPKKK